MNENNHLQQLSLPERVAVLEVQMEELVQIRKKLDELITLKSQGMGALWLVSLLIGSGVLGLVAVVLNFFKRGHL